MENRFLEILVILIITAGSFSSCTRENDDFSFAEFSFEKSLCGLTEYNWQPESNDGEVIVINSKKELDKYFYCTAGERYPAVNFSKHSLLLARGMAEYNFSVIAGSVQQLSTNEYQFDVELAINNKPEGHQFWWIAFTTRKLSGKSNIKLNMIIEETTEIPTQRIGGFLGQICRWNNRNDEKVTVMNSREEMRKNISCHQDEDDYVGQFFDFSKQSLLLADGFASSGIYNVANYSLHQLSSNEYELQVEINLNELTEPAEWALLIRVPKLSEEAIVALKVVELPASNTCIIGKWKLVKMEWFNMAPGPNQGLQRNDFSRHNIVYDFKSNNVLTVSGQLENRIPVNGDHLYSIGNYQQIYIGHNRTSYAISSDKKELVFISTPHDGVDYYFVKIN